MGINDRSFIFFIQFNRIFITGIDAALTKGAIFVGNPRDDGPYNADIGDLRS